MGKKGKLKPRHGNRKPLSVNGLVQCPQGHSRDLIKLSPSAVHKKGSGGKNLRKGQFSHVFGRRSGALSGWVQAVKCLLRKFGSNCLRRLLSLLPDFSTPGHSDLHKAHKTCIFLPSN